MNPVNIYYIKYREKLEENTFKEFLVLLPAFLQAEIKAYKHWESAQASLLGKMLLLYGMKKMQLDFSLDDIIVGYKDRPYIHKDFDFNISHSGEFVMVAISKGAKVGIDIEKHRKLEVALFRKYFNDHEWNRIEQAADPLRAFFELWAIKESAIKCDGRGVEVLSQTHIHSNVTKRIVICDAKEFYFQLIQLAAHYACSVCSDKEIEVRLEELTIPDLKSHK